MQELAGQKSSLKDAQPGSTHAPNIPPTVSMDSQEVPRGNSNQSLQGGNEGAFAWTAKVNCRTKIIFISLMKRLLQELMSLMNQVLLQLKLVRKTI